MDALRKGKSHYAETECRRILSKQGWEVDSAGLLDYVCQRNDEVMFVEVKSAQSIHLRHDQYHLMLKISKHGIKCFYFTPDGGFTEIKEGVPRP